MQLGMDLVRQAREAAKANSVPGQPRPADG